MNTLAILLAAAVVQPQIPRTWSDAEVASLELPLANAKFSPRHISEKAYYQIPERVIYKSYPVYATDKEPPGYLDWLKQQEPQVAFDESKLRTRREWIAAGELVFNAPLTYSPVFFSAAEVLDPAFFGKDGMPVARDGTVPFARWVVRRKGVVELGSMGCNTCHTRVLPDGAVVPGAPGNNPNDREGARMLQRAASHGDPTQVLQQIRRFARGFEMPWLPDDPNRVAESLSLDEFIAAGEAIPPGVTARSNTSMVLPPQIPDLIAVRQRPYLDHTGLVRQRGIGDLMRYASLAQGIFALDQYPGEPALQNSPSNRYSDAQLYALSLYLYSLQPPPNPNRLDTLAARGKGVFKRERCATCHTPPLYTNDKLMPAGDFEPPAHRGSDVLDIRIGTDARYALATRKGTGYYKVPSLKGLWYRGPFGHNGSAATLEDWFDPARLRADYVPTGFRGYDGRTRSIPGHRFGLDLSVDDRRALVAFLKTL